MHVYIRYLWRSLSKSWQCAALTEGSFVKFETETKDFTRTPPSGFAAHLPFQGRLILFLFAIEIGGHSVSWETAHQRCAFPQLNSYFHHLTYISATPCAFFQLDSYFHHLAYIFISSVRIFPTQLVLPSSHIHFYQLRADFSNSARISIISPTFPPIPCVSILAHTFANSRKFRGYRTKLQKSNIIFFNKACFFPSNTV